MSSLDTSNIFAALSKKKKKNTKNLRDDEDDYGTGESTTNKAEGGGGDSATRQGDAESGAIGDAKSGDFDKDLWNTPSLTVSSWADCEDDDLSALGPLPSWSDVRFRLPPLTERHRNAEPNMRCRKHVCACYRCRN